MISAKSEIIKFPKHMVQKVYNLKHWSEQNKGGHFFAFEKPEVFAEEVINFFRNVIDFERCKRECPSPGQGRGVEPGKYAILLGFVAAGAALWTRRRSRL